MRWQKEIIYSSKEIIYLVLSTIDYRLYSQSNAKKTELFWMRKNVLSDVRHYHNFQWNFSRQFITMNQNWNLEHLNPNHSHDDFESGNVKCLTMQKGFQPTQILNAAILRLISWWKMSMLCTSYVPWCSTSLLDIQIHVHVWSITMKIFSRKN